jgi:hypothetical protein
VKESERILNKLGYIGCDPIKISEIEGYISEAIEFMTAAGVRPEKMSSQSAYVIKSLWAENRDKGTEDVLVKADGMIVNLIAQMR